MFDKAPPNTPPPHAIFSRVEESAYVCLPDARVPGRVIIAVRPTLQLAEQDRAYQSLLSAARALEARGIDYTEIDGYNLGVLHEKDGRITGEHLTEQGTPAILFSDIKTQSKQRALEHATGVNLASQGIDLRSATFWAR